MPSLRLPVKTVLSAVATAASFFLFAGPLVAYILEPSSTRSVNCLEDTASTGPFGDGTKFAGVLLLGTAVATIVFARRTLAADEDRAVAWWSLAAAVVTLVAGILIFLAAAVQNYDNCSSWF
jgi:hypothetical protein